MNSRNPNLNQGDILNQFKIVKQEVIPTLQLVYYELEHVTHHTKMIHLSSSDDNNVFMVTFPTHPTNSTGVAHILEHGVLEGSKNYPVKIFKNLSGRSLNTFLNAMTSSDYTSYPFSSCNKKDFFNLMDVYMNASFFPLLDKNTFLQEGWRYEFSDPENPESSLEYRGVVFNEMKGAMSNPVRLFHEDMKKALFPDLTYANASGGDPAFIPELTYEEWKQFHARFYHPSNAVFFTFGDIPLQDLTQRIQDSVMVHFDPSKAVDPVPPQKSYDQPKKMRFTFPVSKSESTENKSFVAVLWKFLESTNFQENLRLELLCTIIAGDSSSVLNRTLLASGLGKGLAPAGFENSFSESVFGTGLMDVNENAADAIESLIMDTLSTLADKPFDEKEIHAAIHELEFSSLEIKGDGGVPFGLSLAFRGLTAFLAGGDFTQALKIHEILEDLRKDALTPGFFSELIKKYFLDNPHRITMILAPEPGGMESMEMKRRSVLDSVQKGMSSAERLSIVEQSLELKRHQSDEGDTSCLPSIELKDISEFPAKILQEEMLQNEIPVYRHPIPTNGITYFSMNFRRPLPQLFPVSAMQFVSVLPELGAAGRSYIEMNQLIREHTGGVSVNPSLSRNISGDLGLNIQISGRCLPRNHKVMMELLGDIVSAPDLSGRERMLELINMQRSYAVPMAAHHGHRMAYLAAGKDLSPMSWVAHNVSGMAGIQRLVKIQPDDIDVISADIQKLLTHLCQARFEHIALTGLNELTDDSLHYISNVQNRLYSDDGNAKISGDSVLSNAVSEPVAWILSTDVSYVAKSFSAVQYGHADAPLLTVLGGLMEKPMYERIRAQSGAYGAFASYDSTAGIYSMMTYRDPHTAASLDAFDDVIGRLAKGQFTDENLHHAIINIISNMDTPPSPREKGLLAFKQKLDGLTFEIRTQYRQGVLNATRDDIVRVVNAYLVNPKRSGIAIVTSDKTLENEETRPLNLKRMSLDD